MDLIQYCVDSEFKNSRLNIDLDTPLKKQELRVRVNENNVILVDSHKDQDLWRLKYICSLISEAILDQNFQFDFILNTSDKADRDEIITRFCFARYRGDNHICIPDPHLPLVLESIKKITSLDSLPWAKKHNKAVFRGSDTGVFGKGYVAQRNELADFYTSSNLVDFKISNFTRTKEESFLGIDPQKIMGKFLSPEEQFKYKYIINCNGNSTSWDRLLWVLAARESECIFVKPRKGEEFMSWYYHMFDIVRPFIEVDGKNIESVVKFGLQSSDPAMRKFLVSILTSRQKHVEYLRKLFRYYEKSYKKIFS